MILPTSPLSDAYDFFEDIVKPLSHTPSQKNPFGLSYMLVFSDDQVSSVPDDRHAWVTSVDGTMAKPIELHRRNPTMTKKFHAEMFNLFDFEDARYGAEDWICASGNGYFGQNFHLIATPCGVLLMDDNLPSNVRTHGTPKHGLTAFTPKSTSHHNHLDNLAGLTLFANMLIAYAFRNQDTMVAPSITFS